MPLFLSGDEMKKPQRGPKPRWPVRLVLYVSNETAETLLALRSDLGIKQSEWLRKAIEESLESMRGVDNERKNKSGSAMETQSGTLP